MRYSYLEILYQFLVGNKGRERGLKIFVIKFDKEGGVGGRWGLV